MYTDAFEVGFLTAGKTITLNPSVYYQHTDNFFDFITTQADDGTLFTTPVNLGTENRYGAELVVSWNPYKWWTVSSEWNYYGFSQQGAYGDIVYDVEDGAWFTRLSSKMKFENSLTVQTNFRYTGRSKVGKH